MCAVLIFFSLWIFWSRANQKPSSTALVRRRLFQGVPVPVPEGFIVFFWIDEDLWVTETMNQTSGSSSFFPFFWMAQAGSLFVLWCYKSCTEACSGTRRHGFIKGREHPLLVCNLHSGVLPGKREPWGWFPSVWSRVQILGLLFQGLGTCHHVVMQRQVITATTTSIRRIFRLLSPLWAGGVLKLP